MDARRCSGPGLAPVCRHRRGQAGGLRHDGASHRALGTGGQPSGSRGQGAREVARETRNLDRSPDTAQHTGELGVREGPQPPTPLSPLGPEPWGQRSRTTPEITCSVLGGREDTPKLCGRGYATSCLKTTTSRGSDPKQTPEGGEVPAGSTRELQRGLPFSHLSPDLCPSLPALHWEGRCGAHGARPPA